MMKLETKKTEVDYWCGKNASDNAGDNAPGDTSAVFTADPLPEQCTSRVLHFAILARQYFARLYFRGFDRII